MDDMKAFDLISSPLTGINLIEASAGTGKTHTISLLVIRLLLEKQITIDKILIVTFTQAATQELRDRVFHLLLLTRDALSNGKQVDSSIDEILTTREDRKRDLRVIRNAIADFDKASIFTIHGFCNRILHDQAFETGNRFDTELLTDPMAILKETAEDFWRKQMYPSPVEFVNYVFNKIKGPGYFFNLLGRMNVLDIRIIPQITDPGTHSLDQYRKTYTLLQKVWGNHRDEIRRLLCDPSLKGNIYGSVKTDDTVGGLNTRTVKIEKMSLEMDRFLFHKNPGFPLFKGFESFTALKLEKSVKKNAVPPKHKFFNTCDDLHHYGNILEKEFQNKFVYLKGHFFEYAHREMDTKKKTRNVQFYNDLILNVRNALLKTIASDHLLIDEIRSKYKAALVDEFQDTDSVQYEIFSKLFSSKEHIFFMIGDPKQSIYSFRGADVFSYMEAARHTDHAYTLTDNWRSNERFIKGVNTLFANVSHPFIFKDITFEPGKAGDSDNAFERWDATPITLWFVPSRKEKPLNKAMAESHIGKAVADEIVHLLSSNSGNTLAREEDIAILVRTNRQALILKNHLSARNIHAVLYSPGDIFDTHEAYEIERLLEGIFEPGNDRKLRSALSTDMIGEHAETFESTEDQGLEEKFERFKNYRRIWAANGFIRMFNQCLIDENVKQRLLVYPDGERRVTNILHLAEILQRESVENKKGMSDLLKWHSEQRDPEMPRKEENQLLLESDRRAVNIVTIHKSKGLEYPIVFCPFSWEGLVRQDDDVFFHDTYFEKKLTYDLRDKEFSPHLIEAQIEKMAENLRLFYVAVTRAKQACYLTWGHINSAETSPLTYLLYGNSIKDGENPIERLTDIYSEKSSDALLSDMMALAHTSKETIQAVELPYGKEDVEIHHPEDKEISLFCRSFHGRINRAWRISSYSSFVSQKEKETELPDYDHLTSSFGEVPVSLPVEEPERPREETDIFSFPKGAKAGIFFHDLLENLEFTTTDPEDHKRIINEKLIAYGFDSEWINPIYRLVYDLLNIPFILNNRRIRLSSIENNHRINEMEFYYPSKRVSPRALGKIFSPFRNHAVLYEFPLHLEQLTFSPTEGFIKGYIDLVFHFEDKFYIIDWKSNFLGNRTALYHTDALAKVMGISLYSLQYYLYALALHQYLKKRYTTYRYNDHFGGVFYVFLRGIDIHSGPEYGIFADLPNQDILNTLGQKLIPEFEM